MEGFMKRGTRMFVKMTALAITGAVTYKLYKCYKNRKNKEPVITVEEAAKLLGKDYTPPEPIAIDIEPSTKEPDGYFHGIPDDQLSPAMQWAKENQEWLTIDEMTDEEFYQEGSDILRKDIDPNSQEAMDSYIRMKVAEFRQGTNELAVIYRLFRKIFEPYNVGDQVTNESLKEDRISYFGENSIWNDHVTWAEVILSYAHRIAFHLGGDDDYWAGMIIDHLGFTKYTTDEYIDIVLEDLCLHDHTDDHSGLFGLFGIDDQAVEFISLKMIPHSVEREFTLEMEFNAFLNQQMRDEE